MACNKPDMTPSLRVKYRIQHALLFKAAMSAMVLKSAIVVYKQSSMQ